MKPSLLLIFLIASIGMFGQKNSQNLIKTIPSVTIYNLKGDTSNLKTLSAGKLTFIDFWFVPCGPCFVEMNMLHKLYTTYKNNPNINFITIAITDSAFVRPLTENRNTVNNDTYEYFKKLALLDTFRLPVYFMKGVENKMVYFKKQKAGGFNGKADTENINNDVSRIYPEKLFGFYGYPTILIFDKTGNVIYKETGFTSSIGEKRRKKIESLVNSKLL